MKRSSTLALLALIVIASGCSGGSDGALVPGQVDADGPIAAPPPDTAPQAPRNPPPPPANQGPAPGCPSVRDPGMAQLDDIASVRTLLVGTYRACMAGGMNLEIRLDPSSDTRLLYTTLDERFVSTGSGDTGTIEIVDCESGSCQVKWQSQGGQYASGDRELRIWTEPTALTVYDTAYLANEWVRIAD